MARKSSKKAVTVKAKPATTVKTATAAADSKSAAAKAAPAKKKPARRSGYKSEVIIQRSSFEASASELVDHVKEIWTKDMGNLVRDLTDIKVYINADEGVAYYVINGDINGKFSL
jgi:hypothetical protein